MEVTSKYADRYFSCAELAKLRLPDFPGSERGVLDRVKEEGWPYVESKARGRTGVRRDYKPPPDILGLIEQRLRGDMPPLQQKPGAQKRQERLPGGEFQYMVSEGPPQSETAVAIDTALLHRCLLACAQVYGDKFAAEPASLQMEYASNFYNLLTRIAPIHPGGARSGIHGFMLLETGGLADQLRLLLQMRWLELYPPPDNGDWSW